jgi:hypothetical protein
MLIFPKQIQRSRCGDLNSQILLGASSNNWLVVWNMNFIAFDILGMSSSQLTFIFVRGAETNQNSSMLALKRLLLLLC